MSVRTLHGRLLRSTAIVAGLAAVLAASVTASCSAAGVVYAPPSAVQLTEVSCEADWVELANTDAKLTANLAGWLLSQGVPGTSKNIYRFPKNTLLKPGSRMVVKAPKLPFKLSCGDNRVYLFRTASAMVDVTTVPNLAAGFAWGRVDSTWRATVPTPGKANAAASADAVVDRAAWLFDPLRTYSIKLTVDPVDLEKLVTSPSDYVAAKFQVQDAAGTLLPAAGPLDVGVRVKGTVGTRTDPIYGPNGLTIAQDKVSLKIKFNFSVPGQRFFGLKKLTLNSMIQDPSMLHEAMAYKLFRDVGVIAPRTGFANVYLNGASRGLYVDVEVYDAISMAWFQSSFAHIYEGQWAGSGNDWYSPDNPAPDLRVNFEVDSGDSQNIADLTALVGALRGATSFNAKAKAHLDLDQLGTFFAVEKFANHWDGYSGSVPWAPNNFFLLSDAAGVFRMLPWGTDTTWRLVPKREGLDARGAEPLDSAVGAMFNMCLNDDRCTSAYLRTLAVAARSTDALKSFGQAVLAAQQSARAADTARLMIDVDYVRPATEADTAASWADLQSYLAMRPTDVATYLKKVASGELRWVPTSLKLAKGVPLTAQNLNAYSDVPGTIVYSAPLGTKLPVGKRVITATFTPADAAYAPQTVSRTFTVG